MSTQDGKRASEEEFTCPECSEVMKPSRREGEERWFCAEGHRVLYREKWQVPPTASLGASHYEREG